MEIAVLDQLAGNVIARGSYLGGPDYEFVIEHDGCVYFRVVGDNDVCWAAPDAESFRRIAAAWNSYQREVVALPTEHTQLQRVANLRRELTALGALPNHRPPDPEPLWSLLMFEAENGLG